MQTSQMAFQNESVNQILSESDNGMVQVRGEVKGEAGRIQEEEEEGIKVY